VSHDVVPGAYADVYKATYEGKTVAVKKLNNAKGFKEFRTEVKFMSTVDHPNIVLLKGICLNPPCIITEFMELGNLHSYLTDFNNKLTWKQCLGIAEDVAKGMNFLHSQSPPRIHRDLKSPNILLASDGQGGVVAKVADFGTARSLAPTIAGRTVDNPIWLAPEIMENEEYTEKADVYSYGIILYEIYSRKFPFGKKTRFQIELDVVEGKRPDLPTDCPPFFMNLTTTCWSGIPSQRPSFAAVIEQLKTPIPITYRALANYSSEAPTSVKVDIGDVMYLDQAGDPNSGGGVKCFHNGRIISLPPEFLHNNCERLAFEDYYYNTYQLQSKPTLSRTSSGHSAPVSPSASFSASPHFEKASENKAKRLANFSKSVPNVKDKKLELERDKDRGLKEDQDDQARQLAQRELVESLLASHGFHRVIKEAHQESGEQPPHLASRLDNTPSLLSNHEALVAVQMIYLPERSLIQSLKKQGNDNLGQGLLQATSTFGKIQGLPGEDVLSKGWVVGTVQQLGSALQGRSDIKEGDKVVPMYSLSSVPIKLTGVNNIVGEEFVFVKGTAAVCARATFAQVPSDLETEVVAMGVEVASCLSQVDRFVPSAGTVLVIGLGKVGLAALCLVRKLAPAAKIIAVDKDDARFSLACSLNKTDHVWKINAANVTEILSHVWKLSGGGAATVLHCTQVAGLEGTAILAAKSGGSVIFCRHNIDMRHVLPLAPSNEVSLITTGGLVSDAHVQSVLEILRTESALRKLFLLRARPTK